jgi:uncharacterized protein
MTEPFDTLMEVQEHDTLLDQLRHRRDSLPERAQLRDLEQRRSQLAEELAGIQSQVDDLAARQRGLEERIAAAAGRRHDIEQRMLTGGAASRDLQAMDSEVHHLTSRQAAFEEEELALLEEEEPLDVLLDEHRRAVEALTAEAERLLVAAGQAETEIDRDIAAEEVARETSADGLPNDLRDRYEALRARKGGIGAARLVGDRCDGCHLTLPSVEVERIRLLPPGEFATCDQCDRILVH